MGSFCKSFSESFDKTATVSAAGTLDVIKEKIKQNDEVRKSSAALDALEIRIVQNATSKAKNPQEAAEMAFTASASIDALRKAKLPLETTTTLTKMMFPELKTDSTPINVYNVGQGGELTSAGQVPAGSKVFKQALTPDEIGARVKSSEEAKYGGVKEEAARAFDLRKEFQAIPQVKDFQIIKNQVSSMDALLNQVKLGDGKSALALDQGLITMFNKITDPTSVVRESEYDRTPKNLSLVNRFQGAIQKLDKGGAGLTQEDRESLVFGAKVIADSRGSAYNEVLSNYENLSTEFGVKPGLVTSGYGKFESFLKAEPKAQSFKSEADAIKAGKKKGDRVVIGGVSGTLT